MENIKFQVVLSSQEWPYRSSTKVETGLPSYYMKMKMELVGSL